VTFEVLIDEHTGENSTVRLEGSSYEFSTDLVVKDAARRIFQAPRERVIFIRVVPQHN
jgi:hypothetical protein